MSETSRVLDQENESVVLMTPEAFTRMIDVLNKTFGSAGLSMIHLMGKEKGIYDVSEELRSPEASGEERTKQQQLERVLKRVGERGWGDVEVTQFDMLNGAVTIVVKDSPFGSLCVVPDSSYCFFVRGYLSGILSEVTEYEMQYSESKCPMQGHEHCQIHFIKMQ